MKLGICHLASADSLYVNINFKSSIFILFLLFLFLSSSAFSFLFYSSDSLSSTPHTLLFSDSLLILLPLLLITLLSHPFLSPSLLPLSPPLFTPHSLRPLKLPTSSLPMATSLCPWSQLPCPGHRCTTMEGTPQPILSMCHNHSQFFSQVKMVVSLLLNSAILFQAEGWKGGEGEEKEGGMKRRGGARKGRPKEGWREGERKGWKKRGRREGGREGRRKKRTGREKGQGGKSRGKQAGKQAMQCSGRKNIWKATSPNGWIPVLSLQCPCSQHSSRSNHCVLVSGMKM